MFDASNIDTIYVDTWFHAINSFLETFFRCAIPVIHSMYEWLDHLHFRLFLERFSSTARFFLLVSFSVVAASNFHLLQFTWKTVRIKSIKRIHGFSSLERWQEISFFGMDHMNGRWKAKMWAKKNREKNANWWPAHLLGIKISSRNLLLMTDDTLPYWHIFNAKHQTPNAKSKYAHTQTGTQSATLTSAQLFSDKYYLSNEFYLVFVCVCVCVWRSIFINRILSSIINCVKFIFVHSS